jgi:hypothetical protein
MIGHRLALLKKALYNLASSLIKHNETQRKQARAQCKSDVSQPDLWMNMQGC